MFCLNSNLFLVISKLLRSYSRLMVAPDELEPMWLTHRVISDRVHRLLFTLSYFRPDRFVQLLIPIQYRSNTDPNLTLILSSLRVFN